MHELSVPVFLYVETPLHPGAGGGLSHIDLPVDREVHSSLPRMSGSGIKGVLKCAARDGNGVLSPEMIAVFGPDDMGHEHASAVSFRDAWTLAFPVRSLNGLFAWTTCPYVLARLKDNLLSCGGMYGTLKDVPVPELAQGECWFPAGSPVSVSDTKIVLEDGVFTRTGDSTSWITKLSEFVFTDEPPESHWKSRFTNSLVILSDTDFGDFTRRSTQVSTRIRIDPKKGTAQGQGLWTEEYLPTDTILYTIAHMGRPLSKDFQAKKAPWVWTQLKAGALDKHKRLQFGGDDTTGKGVVRLIYPDPTTSGGA